MNSDAHSAAAPLRTSLILLALAVAPGRLLAQITPTDWSIDPAQSRLTVDVPPGGLLASALHTHHFQPADWGGEIAWDPEKPGSVRVDVKISADSLRDHQPKLSAKDIAKVEGQTRGPEILDSAKFPRISFEAREVENLQAPSAGGGEFRAMLAGSLTLHGKTRPLRFPIHGRIASDKLEASATITFKQSDFGIKPYKTALGTISVRDEVTIEISLVAIPHKRLASSLARR